MPTTAPKMSPRSSLTSWRSNTGPERVAEIEAIQDPANAKSLNAKDLCKDVTKSVTRVQRVIATEQYSLVLFVF